MPAPTDSQPILGGMHICRPKPLTGKTGQKVGLRLMSDLHIGAGHCDYKLMERELDEAEEKGDRVLINGDLLDLILPKDAKRFTPGNAHPRIARRNDQVNAAIEWAVELLSPVAHLIDMVGIGNHEQKITHYHSVDPTLLVLYELEKIARARDPEHVIHYGGYTGFVDYRLRDRGDADRGGSRWVLYYHHGSGGAAPVTKGLIDFNRKDVFIDADMIWMGHKHNRLCVSVEKIRCPQSGDNPDVRQVFHCMTGAYFQTYCGQSQASVRKHGRQSNYAADAGLAPGGKGGLRVVLEFMRSGAPSVQVIQ